MTAAGFKRLWSTPRRCSRGGLLDYPTPQQRYLRMQSLVRYRRRPDAYEPGKELLQGELGHVDSFRFITSTPLPDFYPTPPAVLAGYQAALRSGTSAMILGFDLASGPDWTAVYSWPDLVPEPPRPALTLQDLQRITRAELKRGRRADKLRQLSAKGAIARG